MPVVSIRFSSEPLREQLKERAELSRVSISSLAERLIDEGLRMEAHPLIFFRDGRFGRVPRLMGGPDVIDVVGTVVEGDVPTESRLARAAQLLAIPVAYVEAALAYYAAFTSEVDAELKRRDEFAEMAEAAWRRRNQILSR